MALACTMGMTRPLAMRKTTANRPPRIGKPQSAGDVVGGATAKGAIRAAHLEQLSEGRLAEGGGGSQDRDEPHPQYGAWSAHDERQRDPDDVAGSHPAGQPDGEGLEGGDAAVAAVREPITEAAIASVCRTWTPRVLTVKKMPAPMRSHMRPQE